MDKDVLVSIYEEHSPGIYRYASRLLPSRDLAEDCVSDTFSKFLLAVRDREGKIENPKAYLYRIAHNWITDHYRRQPPPPIDLEPEKHTDPMGNPAVVVDQNLERERIRNAILRLPVEQQQVLELRFFENWSHEEVARTIGKTPEASRTLQTRALAALRRMLVERNEETVEEEIVYAPGIERRYTY